MRATIVVNLANTAFDEWPEGELGRILHDLARKIEDGRSFQSESLIDTNRNTVGHYALTD